LAVAGLIDCCRVLDWRQSSDHWLLAAHTVGAALFGPDLWFSCTWLHRSHGYNRALIGLSFPVGVVMAQETWPQGVGLASALVMGIGWAPGGLGASFTGFVADHYALATGLQLLIFPPLLGLACALGYGALQRRSLRVAPPDPV
jgi:hypothetical protein